MFVSSALHIQWRNHCRFLLVEKAGVFLVSLSCCHVWNPIACYKLVCFENKLYVQLGADAGFYEIIIWTDANRPTRNNLIK